MKLSVLSYLLCLLSLCSFLAETLALPVSLSEPSLLEPRAAVPKPAPKKSPPAKKAAAKAAVSRPGTPNKDPVRAEFDRFVKWLKTGEGQKVSNICFYSGQTAGKPVFGKLQELRAKTGCHVTDTIIALAKVSKATSLKWSTPDWAVISRLLAHNAKGKAKVLLGDVTKHDAIFWVDELPILQDRQKRGLVTGIEQWKINAKGALVGPSTLTSKRPA